MAVDKRRERSAAAPGPAPVLEIDRALLAAIVQAIPVGVVAVESESGRLVLANDEATQIGGELDVEDWPVLRALRRGELMDRELMELVRDDASHLLLDVRSVLVPATAGGPSVILAVFHDVTDRERSESAQREFITNAAHELLTPLAAITSAVEVLQGGAKEDPAQRDRFLGHAERETARLGRLARALLVLAHAQMGTEAPKSEIVGLAPLLEDVVAELRVAPGVSVAVDCPPELALVTNRELASQAFENLGANAAKFTPSGSILFRGRAAGDSSVVVEVRDSGSGVAEDEAERVFERFYRSRRTRTSEGFGLGLAIAREAVEALGGHIELSSSVGEGTTVSVTLPGARLVRR